MLENNPIVTHKGPTGFLTDGQGMLVVEDGQIFKDGQYVGVLFEDGYLQSFNELLGKPGDILLIESIAPWQFRGIDSGGGELSLPDAIGPTGDLTYNGRPFKVINGRIIAPGHRYVAQITDEGQIYIRQKGGTADRIKLDNITLLNFIFEGKNSKGDNWQHQFARPLYRPDRSYTDNEIIRYFDGFDALNALQKKYILETMALWSSCGILQIVRKSEGDASLGNVKHGATGVTRIRTGNVSLDKEEFEREVNFFKKYGPIMNVSKNGKGQLEVRLNLVMAHEFGHQVDFVLMAAVQEQVLELYEKRKKGCDKLHRLAGPDQSSELLMPQQLEQRHFISGYAKASAHEYWAESLAAFSLKETRDYLKEVDPVIYQIMVSLIKNPTAVFSRVLHETLIGLQASLRLGGEFTDELSI